MKKVLLSVIIFFTLLILSLNTASAQQKQSARPTQEQLKGIIVSVGSQSYSTDGMPQSVSYRVKLENSKETVTATYNISNFSKLSLNTGDIVVITKNKGFNKTTQYQIVDKYRLGALLYFVIAFIITALLVVGRKGMGSLAGLFISLTVILYGIVPAILKGYDPLWVTVVGSCTILFFTTYLAHGVSKKTTVALVSTFFSLVATFVISLISIQILELNGYGSEGAYDIFLATNMVINAKGLFLSGVIIGTLGALNDVTVTQAETIFQLKKLDKSISFSELWKRGMDVGRAHGASMVNTIVLAYAGSSLFIFLFFILNPQQVPVWAILNNEFTVEEIVKTLGGTIGILLSVPIVTFTAAFIVNKYHK